MYSMVTLGLVREGTYIVKERGKITSAEILHSKDNKVNVVLPPKFIDKHYFIAGPDIDDNYYISDACGMAIRMKGETYQRWSESKMEINRDSIHLFEGRTY